MFRSPFSAARSTRNESLPLRSSAKNHAYVGVVVDPSDYELVLAELRAAGGLRDVTRAQLALG